MQFTKRSVFLAVMVVMGAAALLKWGLSDTEPVAVRETSLPMSAPRGDALNTPPALPAQTSASMRVAPATVSSVASRAASSRPEAAGMPPWERNPPDLGLTRVLSGEQDVLLGGRPYKVLGTKPSMAEETLGQPVLLVRDQKSGQVEFFQSGLQFRLAAGQNYTSFLREYPQLQVVFFNADFAKVKVDAASIAENFRKLSADPRVTFVGFLLPQAVLKPK